MNQTLSVLVRKALDSNARAILITAPVLCNGTESEKVHLQSPCFLLYTRFGLVPFVTSDLMEKYMNVKLPAAIAVPISSVFEHLSALECTRGLHEFTALRVGGKRPLIYLTSNDCVPRCDTLEKFDAEEHVNDKQSGAANATNPRRAAQLAKKAKVTIWTRHGRTNANSTLLNKLVNVVQPSMLHLNTGSQLDEPIFTFNDVIVFESGEPDALAPRDEAAEQVVQQGAVFDSAVRNGAFSLRAEINQTDAAIFAKRTNSNVRVANTVWHPIDILDAVASGVDLFVGSLPYIASLRDHALTFAFDPAQAKRKEDSESSSDDESRKLSIGLASDRYANAHVKLAAGCECFACVRYTRAYVHHLVVAHELLARTAIMMHNLAHFYAFADRVRQAVRDGTLQQYTQFMRDQLAADTCELDAALLGIRNRSRRETATRERERDARDQAGEQESTRKRLRTESGNETSSTPADGVSTNS